MNSLFRYVLLFLLILTDRSGFGQSQGTMSAKTTVIDQTVACKLHPEHTYQVFVPSVDPDFKQLPLLVAIDPHGNGKLAVAGLKEAAQKYQMVVVGSNLIRNNDTTYIREIDELIADVKNRFPVGNILFIGGFSGGARMSLDYATKHPVNGVIACGALAKPVEINLLNCRVMCIIGMDDFNFIEAAPFITDPASIPSNLSIEMIKGAHNWPEKELLKLASGQLLLSVAPPGNLVEKRKIVKEYVDQQKKRIDSLVRINESLQAALVSHNMMSSSVFEREGSFFGLFDNLMQNENSQRQVGRLAQSFQMETKIREEYMNALFQKDPAWWSHEIEVLDSKIISEKEIYTQMVYQRVKSFLGIICYSFCQHFEEDKNAQKLEQVLSVYRLVEPHNSEMLRFSKVLDQMKRLK
jgi:hypothetical protein